MTSDINSISPPADGHGRILQEIVDALSSVPSVRAIGVFGSLAYGTADRFSDIDMMVGCDNLPSTKWMAGDAIRSAKRVLYYREFGKVEQPAGRYWFCDESPFHKLDVSFHTMEEYLDILRKQYYIGHDIVFREIYHLDATRHRDTISNIRLPLSIGPAEQEIGLWIYRLIERTKACMRGSQAMDDLISTRDSLTNKLRNLSSEAVIAGGDIHSLVQRILEITDQVICIRK
jgi:predicted nucleotidyltransferase